MRRSQQSGGPERLDTILAVATAELQRLQKLKLAFDRECSQLPAGKVVRKTCNGRHYYYLADKEADPADPEHPRLRLRSLGKNDGNYRDALWRRSCLAATMPFITGNIKELERLVDRYRPVTSWPIYRETKDEPPLKRRRRNSVTNWENAPFETNPLHPEGLIHMSQAGTKVRSKSETLIAGLLETYKVPYRYEARLDLLDRHMYPDFTIRRKRDGEIFYWEHFGMTDDPNYLAGMDSKMALYREAGIAPWTRLIVTYDCENGSIDARTIENLVRVFLL